MTSSKTRKTAKKQKNCDFCEFLQLWNILYRPCFENSCFPFILSIFSMQNNCGFAVIVVAKIKGRYPDPSGKYVRFSDSVDNL